MRFTALLCLLTCGLCWAQPAGDSQPASSNVMGPSTLESTPTIG